MDVLTVIILVFYAVMGTIGSFWYHRSTRKLRARNSKLLNDVKVLADTLVTVRRQKEEYFRSIEAIVVEANQWRRLYFSENTAHSNAQQLLFRELTRLSVQYQRATKRPAPLSAGIANVLHEYAEQHPTPNPPDRAELPAPAEKAVATTTTT